MEPNYNINLSLPCWEEVNGNQVPFLQRKQKLLLHGVFIRSVFISLGIKLLLFQLLRFLKQQSRASFPATRKPTCLEKYPDISKIGKTHLSFGEDRAIPLHYKLASGGATCFNPCVCLFYSLAWLPAGLLLIHQLAPRRQWGGRLDTPLPQPAKTSVCKFNWDKLYLQAIHNRFLFRGLSISVTTFKKC